MDSLPGDQAALEPKGFSGPIIAGEAEEGMSSNKVMMTIFWNIGGIIHINYFQMEKIVNGE